MNWGRVIQASCENVEQPPDSRCSDLAFALANPSVCPVAPFLTLKPAIGLICVLGSIQLRAVYTKDGVETDVTNESVFTSSDLTIALIGVQSGNATGIAEGNVTFTATYLGLTAHADMSVLGGDCCADETVAMMVLVDTSRSMSQAFGSGYQTRLAYAKAAATRFINEVNETKDVVGLLTFNANAVTTLAAPTASKASVAALVPGISQTQQKTAFYDAIVEARSALDDVADAGRKIIVILSDGEDSTPSYNDANNPVALLDDFKSIGGIVICLGIRSSGRGFALLSRLSTGGFFINGYGTTASAALDFLSGLKGYVCAGNCAPEGDETVATGELNYTDFINWDVVEGYVDLQGNWFFDYLPGNGLYVDMISGTQPSGVPNGKLVLKTPISVVGGEDYRVTFSLAGNQLVERSDTVRVQVWYKNNDDDETPTYFLNQIVTLNDYSQEFQNYAFSFTADADRDVYISVKQENVPPGDGYARAGILLGGVTFENLTDGVMLFEDDFDGENLTYIPPRCGTGSVYPYLTSYNCYGEGCLDEPPPAQTQDPSPLPDIEAGYTPPKTYTSTKSSCESCPAGSINVDTENLVPVMTSNTEPSGEVLFSDEDSDLHPPWHVFDRDPSTYWEPTSSIDPAYIGYKFDTGKIVNRYELTANESSGVDAPRDFVLEASNDGETWVALDERNGLTWFGGETKSFQVSNSTSYTYYRIRMAATYVTIAGMGLFLVGAAQICEEATETSEISQQDADTKALAAAQAAALAQLNCQTVYTSTQSYTAICPSGKFGANVTKSATRSSTVSQKEADDAALLAAQVAALEALDCTGSNNTQRLNILDGPTPPTRANPYPSVKYISTSGTTIQKVVLHLNRFNHGNYADVAVLLVSPSGTAVQVLGNTMDAAFDTIERNFHLDDDAADDVPENSRPAGVEHTYKPTIYVGQLTFPEPAPAGPYATTMAAFIGENPNGSWALYVADDTSLDDGYFLQGWGLTIVTELSGDNGVDPILGPPYPPVNYQAFIAQEGTGSKLTWTVPEVLIASQATQQVPELLCDVKITNYRAGATTLTRAGDVVTLSGGTFVFVMGQAADYIGAKLLLANGTTLTIVEVTSATTATVTVSGTIATPQLFSIVLADTEFHLFWSEGTPVPADLALGQEKNSGTVDAGITFGSNAEFGNVDGYPVFYDVVIPVEGMPPFEKKVYFYVGAEADAVFVQSNANIVTVNY